MRRLDLTKVDTEHFLECMEVRNLNRETEEEWRFSCPFTGHAHGDADPACKMNDETTQWFCHGCKRYGNAITFLAEHEGVSPLTARRWIRDEYDSVWREPEGGATGQWRRRFQNPETGSEVNPPLDEELLDDFPSTPQSEEYLRQRGFSGRIILDWELGWDPRSEMVTIPVRDDEGRLVGIKGRAVDPEAKPKYKAIGDATSSYTRYGFPTYEKSRVVFGLDRVDPGWLVVCEGELNVIALHQMNVTNAVGIAGSNLSEIQAALLINKADEITLWLDEDQAGFAAIWGWVDEKEKFHPGIWEALSPHMTLRIVHSPKEGWDAADYLKNGVEGPCRGIVQGALPAMRERYDHMVR